MRKIQLVKMEKDKRKVKGKGKRKGVKEGKEGIYFLPHKLMVTKIKLGKGKGNVNWEGNELPN